MCTHTHTHVLGGEGWENEVGGKSQFIHTHAHTFVQHISKSTILF